MLGVLATTRESGSPLSEDGRAAQREHWHPADDGGAVGEGVDRLSTMGVEEAAVECTANLERSLRRCSKAAICGVTPVRGLVDGFLRAKTSAGC